MNEKMKNLLAEINKKQSDARALIDNSEIEKASALMDEAEKLQKEYDVEARLYEAEKNDVPDVTENKTDKADAFKVVAKVLSRNRLTDAEDALLTGTTGDNSNGENYIMPQEISTEIQELRKTYNCAKDLVSVQPVNDLKGSYALENSTTYVGLSAFDDDDDDDIVSGTPKFTNKEWVIKHYGKIVPVSNILLGTAKGLMAYINKWFIRNAVITENVKIFAKLIVNKVATNITGCDDIIELKDGLDDSYLTDAVIVTNKSGFKKLKKEKYTDGRRKIGTDDLIKGTARYLDGVLVKVFTDAELPNVAGKAPVFVGSLKAGINFLDYDKYEIATSTEAEFKKNRTVARIIEGFDLVQEDTNAYEYALLSLTDAVESI